MTIGQDGHRTRDLSHGVGANAIAVIIAIIIAIIIVTIHNCCC